MIVTASTLSSFQRCPRQYLLSLNNPAQRRWRPRSLFIRVLRNAVHRISAGEALASVRSQAVNEFMEHAAKPGLDVTVDPFTLASDYAAMLQTVITALHAGVARSLCPLPSIILSPSVTWSSRVLADPAGSLHAWVAVDAWTDGVMARELHGWYVLGEIACTGMPMTLHVVEIGRQSGSHQLSPWCRCYRHPLLMGRFAFQSKTGKPLGPNWKAVYYQDSQKNDPKEWVDLMQRDNVQLIHHVPVRAIAPSQAARIRQDICQEAAGMAALEGVSWQDIPMRRTSCDVPPCVWQTTCYRR